MNRNFALSLLLATAAVGNAFADDITMDNTPFTSTLSRAQVQADLQQARAAGVDPWAQDYDHLAGLRSDRTRAEVTAEYIAERDEVASLNGEDSGSVQMARRDLPQPIAHVAAAE
ncbi:MAG: hypothetical protein JWQ76_184 [Ramlibacter sp.]|nr:hypothetical protein [Ramlibacter sp.]